MPAKRASFVVAALFLASATSFADPTAGTMVKGKCTATLEEYQKLADAFGKGDWTGLQKGAAPLVGRCAFGETKPDTKPDTKRDWVSLMMVGKDWSGKPTLLDFLVHDPAPDRPFTRTLPGLRTTGQTGEARFFELFIAPKAGLDFKAGYSIERVADPVAAQTAAFLKKAFDVGAVLGGLGLDMKSVEPETPIELDAWLVEVTMPFERAKVTAEHLVTGVEGAPENKLTPTLEYQNVPLRRWTYGLLVGGIAWSKADDRAKVEKNELSADPLPATLSMAIVNIHPKAYDEKLPRMSGAERFRFFAGTVLTPGFGVGAGVGVGLVRGFALNAGGAAFLTRRLREGDSFGSAPSDPNNATRTGVGTALFVGVSYGFE